MAFDETLAERIRDSLEQTSGIVEKKMFGGLCFMLNGNILVGVWKDSLIARIGPEAKAEVMGQPFVHEFDITGKPMKGWIVVEPEGLDDEDSLNGWVKQAIDFVGAMPAK